MSTKPSPFQLMIDPAPALAAAKRLRAHLPPYSFIVPMASTDDEADEAKLRSEEARAGQG